MFHARKWGWKRVAARLLLIPVLAGTTAGFAHAQTRSPGGQPAAPPRATQAMPAAPAQTNRPADPKQLLKDGRKALGEGNLDLAQDLARAAAANNPSGKWGLFDDTPNSLLADVQTARMKANKTQAEQFVKGAKTLLAKPAQNDAERAYNLDEALKMAREADRLHGPYSVWDTGDRPDKLIKDVEVARAKLRVSPVPQPPAGANAVAQAGGTMPGNTGVRPAGGPAMPNQPVRPAGGATQMPAPNATPTAAAPGKMPAGPAQPGMSADAKKQTAIKLMTEGKVLADSGEFVAAKAKYLEADRLGAVFAANEPNPAYALRDLSVKGTAAIDRLIRESREQTAKGDFEKAHLALNAASDVVTALNLFPRPVEEARAALRQASGGKYGTATMVSAGPAAPTIPVATTKGTGDLPIPVKPPTQVAGGPTAPVMPAVTNPSSPPGVASVGQAGKPATGGNPQGRQLLDQAALELQKGDLEMARKLALQAHNLGGVQDEARGLLNQIDAEALAVKQRTAVKSFDAAVQAHGSKDYSHALSVFVLIDPKHLPPEKAAKRDELMTACRAELEKSPGMGSGVVATAGMQEPPALPSNPSAIPMGMPTPNAPGVARVGSDPTPGTQPKPSDPMRNVAFQKLRSDGLKVQADAQAAFGRGETDVAIQMLLDYGTKVRSASELDPASVAMLLRPIESRLEMFRVMKGQADALAREKKEKAATKEMIAGRGAAEEQRKAEVQRLVRSANSLAKAGDFASAEKAALQAKQLDPDNEAVVGLAQVYKMQRRVKEQEQLKSDKEGFNYAAFTNAEQPGPFVSVDDPVRIKIEMTQRAARRGSLDDVYLRNRTPKEYEIEIQLEKPISLEFNQTPLELAVDNLRALTGLPIVFEYPAIEAEGLSTVKPITLKPGASISAKNLLHLTLEQAQLGYVIEHDAVKITTVKRSKGRMVTKVFSVADLVTPIPNFALPDYANLDKMINRNPLNSGNIVMPGLGGSTPYAAPNGLQGGVPAGTMPGLNPGISGGTPFGPGGSLETRSAGPAGGPNPLSGSVRIAPDSNTKQEQLIKLITGMVRPYSWDGMGGGGRIEYYDVGSALVVNQTADVIREVADLLEALRRLQDLAVAVEIRIVSLSETFFERMGVDFSMNIKTNSNTAKFEPQLTSGVFRPDPFINDISTKGVTVGLTPAGSFTPDLDVPIRSTSFQYAIPGFGGYPNNPGFNGGVSLGLAFLNDIQVFMFMEAAQGDRRVNVMQAPKITLFNGQTATLNVSSFQFFVTQVQVVSVNGQIVFVPQNTPFPSPDTNFNLAVQAVVSADRRFVRLNLPVTMSAQTGATVPLFPVTTFITPVFEGGSQGVPIPFTQFLQQPSYTTLSISTTVVCPDGGTVLLGGLKTLREGRNESGPPFLSKIQYVNRLFKNVGIGRETEHIMIMVTPRIIINAEEEVIQTEGRVFGAGPGGP